MLTNGGFENGTLLGWQSLCASTCMSSPGSLFNSVGLCHTGLYCFMDGCKNKHDFLRQPFQIVIGHVYRLNYWINVSRNQDVFVKIF